MHQSIPPAPSPPPPGLLRVFASLVSPGDGAFANFALPGGRTFANPRAIPELFDAHAVSYQNVTTQRILLEKKKKNILALLSRTGINCRGLERHVLDFTCLCAFLHYLSSHNYFAKLEVSIWINVFWFILNQISVDIIWRRSFHIYKTIHNI